MCRRFCGGKRRRPEFICNLDFLGALRRALFFRGGILFARSGNRAARPLAGRMAAVADAFGKKAPASEGGRYNCYYVPNGLFEFCEVRVVIGDDAG